MIETKAKPSLLEKFGIFYINFFQRIDKTHNVFDFSDKELTQKVKSISRRGIIYSSLIGIICVFPTVWVSVAYPENDWLVYYGRVAVVTLISVIIELYILFLIALKCVYEVSDIINIHATKNELLDSNLFGVKHILSRTALELPDPELKILGIDPFKRISKKNLLILSLLYKAKIFLTNFVAKFVLKFFCGNTIFGIPILYEALPVECFWNSVVIERVVREARLRLFGFALANQICNTTLANGYFGKLSQEAKIGCLRAIGNAVVMTQNYHPNMIVLLLRFQEILQIDENEKLDDWQLFLDSLQRVTDNERNFLLDIFTVSAAFDGKLSKLEKENLRSAFGNDFDLYFPRINKLTQHLQDGKLNAALALCNLDFVKG